jgi:CRP/FNR family transcriptional regulator, anaerobic regulatory protein
MNAHPRPAVAEAAVAQVQRTGPASQASELDWGRAASSAQYDIGPTEPIHLDQSSYTVPARRIICREQDLHDAIPIICAGWAASVVTLSDGSRQILSFLLPGDLVSTALLFAARAHCMVEAITEVRYHAFKRGDLKATLLKDPDLFDKLSQAWAEEKTRADQLIVDLGRRPADERIARLIMNLAERLERRGMMGRLDTMAAIEMDFPLRQHHIADATGLTPVHVSKMLSEFRRNGLIRISDRTLTILDPAGFRRIADMR